jgi:hypothetical protein
MTDHLPAVEQPLHFDDFANQLLAEGAQQSPSQLHGGICGILAGAGPVDGEDCIAAAGQALDLGLHGELAESSLRLADVSRRAMQDEAFDFHLMLPDDDTEMGVRVQALSEWCRGFLAGYALVVSEERAGLGEETAEVLKDVAAIANAGHDEEADEDDAEGDFFELTEYLRFACLNLFMSRLQELEDSGARGESP